TANRTCDARRPCPLNSGEGLPLLDPESHPRSLPWAIEPAVGVERTMAAILVGAYGADEVNGETRVVLRLHHNLAPVEVAVMPLSKKEELIAPAREVQDLLRPHFRVEYDQTGGHIGRRYRRQDEIGTPFCVTVDFDTLNDRAVTIRERDSMEQERVPIAGLLGRLQERLA